MNFDESTSIGNRRILNISLAKLGQSFYLTSEEIPEGTFDTERIPSIVLRNLERLMPSNFDWTCINSFSTDTCSTMLKAWSVLKQASRVSKAFTIPCDSHGIQLVLKEIFGLGSIKYSNQQKSSNTSNIRRNNILSSEDTKNPITGGTTP